MMNKTSNPVNRMDFVKISDGKKVYLVTQQDKGLYLWDFQAWLEGYYDAYIPLVATEYDEGYNKLSDTDELTVIGNFKDNPELLPKECEGYNGEPNVEVIETLWTNKDFNGCADGSNPCCKNRNMIFTGDLAWCPKHCSCHEKL